MKALRFTVWVAAAALVVPALVAALPACVVAEHCAMGAMGAMGAAEAMPADDAPDCHRPTVGAGDCCFDKAPAGAPVERLGTVPESGGALAPDSTPAPRDVSVSGRPVPGPSAGLSPPLSARFRALLL